MNCPQCGLQIRDGDWYCPKCNIIVKNYSGTNATMENDPNSLYQFTGLGCSRLLVDYTPTIRAYSDCLKIYRTGRTGGVPAELMIPYEHLINISCRKRFGTKACWLEFEVAGVRQNTQTVSSMDVGLGITQSYAEENVWNDPYKVAFHKNEFSKLEKHCTELNNILQNFKKTSRSPSTVVTHTDSSLDKLKKLKELHELGILTDSEYEEKRQKLISEI